MTCYIVYYHIDALILPQTIYDRLDIAELDKYKILLYSTNVVIDNNDVVHKLLFQSGPDTLHLFPMKTSLFLKISQLVDVESLLDYSTLQKIQRGLVAKFKTWGLENVVTVKSHTTLTELEGAGMTLENLINNLVGENEYIKKLDIEAARILNAQNDIDGILVLDLRFVGRHCLQFAKVSEKAARLIDLSSLETNFFDVYLKDESAVNVYKRMKDKDDFDVGKNYAVNYISNEYDHIRYVVLSTDSRGTPAMRAAMIDERILIDDIYKKYASSLKQ